MVIRLQEIAIAYVMVLYWHSPTSETLASKASNNPDAI